MGQPSSVEHFENSLDARFARMKQELPLVVADLRGGAEPAARLSRRNFTLLLYSYWEAIVKENVKDYVLLAQNLSEHYSDLNESLYLAHHRKIFSKCTKVLRKAELTSTFNNYSDLYHGLILKEQPDLYDPELFGANSNLKPKQFERILQWLGLSVPELRLSQQDPGNLAVKETSAIARKTEYYYSWGVVEKYLNSFVGSRNGLAHSALCNAPDLELCLFYNVFICGLLDWLATTLRYAVDNQLWRSARIVPSSH